MNYYAFITLILTLAAALLALNSEPFKNSKLTKTGWIAIVAILAFLIGVRDLYVKEAEEKFKRLGLL